MNRADWFFFVTALLVIALAIFRVVVPQLRGLWHSWKELRRADRLHRQHMEFRQRKEKERR